MIKIELNTIVETLLISMDNGNYEVAEDLFEAIRSLESQQITYSHFTPVFNEGYFKASHQYNQQFRVALAHGIKETGDEMLEKLYKQSLLFDAPYNFDCYCRYIEWNREPTKRFYEPRRKQLKPIVDLLQRLADDELDLVAISLPPGIGKTTIAIFFLTFIGGRNPELSILGGSHSNSFLEGVYGEILRIIDKDGEYLYNDVFPKSPLVRTNAKNMRIDLEASKRFETFEFSSIGSGNAGKVRASNLLYCDDLVDGIETALSRDRLDKLWQQYYTDLRQRKIGKCKELHIATRWSVNDPIGRLSKEYENNPRTAILSVPALDENDESNFDYPYHLGFTTQFYREQREIMDSPSWKALYMNEPIEREGQLYPDDQLRRYFELPETEPDAIIGVCDTKTTGSDYCVLPIAYQYGSDFFIDDVVCENYAPDIVENSVINKLVQTKPHLVQFESNVAGGRMAQIVQESLKKRGVRTKITSKYTTANKETKIQMAQPWVLEHCLFKDDSVLKGSENAEYREFLRQLCGYTLTGKNKHDDVPDAMAQFANFVQYSASSRGTIGKRPF